VAVDVDAKRPVLDLEGEPVGRPGGEEVDESGGEELSQPVLVAAGAGEDLTAFVERGASSSTRVVLRNTSSAPSRNLNPDRRWTNRAGRRFETSGTRARTTVKWCSSWVSSPLALRSS